MLTEDLYGPTSPDLVTDTGRMGDRREGPPCFDKTADDYRAIASAEYLGAFAWSGREIPRELQGYLTVEKAIARIRHLETLPGEGFARAATRLADFVAASALGVEVAAA